MAPPPLDCTPVEVKPMSKSTDPKPTRPAKKAPPLAPADPAPVKPWRLSPALTDRLKAELAESEGALARLHAEKFAQLSLAKEALYEVLIGMFPYAGNIAVVVEPAGGAVQPVFIQVKGDDVPGCIRADPRLYSELWSS